MNKITEWIVKKPKIAYLCAMSLLVLSTIISIVRIFHVPDKEIIKKQDLPSMDVLEKKETLAEKKMKFEWVSSELETYQNKIDSNSLDKSDSMRIEKLYNEYLRLKNGD